MKTKKVIIEGIDAKELIERLREVIVESLKTEHPPPSEKRSPLMTLQETADFFVVTPRSIHNWCGHGLLSPVYIGRRVYFEETEVQDLVQKNKTKKKIHYEN